MTRIAAAVIVWLASAASVLAASEPFYEVSEPLRHSYAAHMIAARLEAMAAVADRDRMELVEDTMHKATQRELHLLVGRLRQHDRALADKLAESLERLAAEVKGKPEPAAVRENAGKAAAIVGKAHRLLVPDADRREAALTAAVIAMLLLNDDGMAEAYEDAVEGEHSAYPTAWAVLQRVDALWREARQRSPESEARDTVDEALLALHTLVPSPVPPKAIAGDPEDAEEPSHRIVAALERLTGADLHPDRDLARLVGYTRELAGSGCEANPGHAALGLERITWSRMYTAYFAKPLSLFGPDEMARLEAVYEQIGAAAGQNWTPLCPELLDALDEARHVFGG